MTAGLVVGCATSSDAECETALRTYETEQASRAHEIEVAEDRYAEQYAAYQRHKLDNPLDAWVRPPFRPAPPPPFAVNAARAEAERACGVAPPA